MNYRIDRPLFLRNLQLHPLLIESPEECRLRAIGSLLGEKRIQIEELDAPVINKIDINNLGDDSLLLIDGEEITGAMQNRIVSASTFIPARTRKTISVVCVEEGRWRQAGRFTTGFCSYPRIRSILLGSKSDRERQEHVWNEITRKLTSTRINSVTSSMHDIFKGLDDELDRYFEDFKALNGNTAGFIAVAGNRILGADLFANQAVFRQFEHRLIRGYAMEAYELTRNQSGTPDTGCFFTVITKALEPRRTDRKARIRFSEQGIAGQAIFHRGTLLHLSAFPR